MVANVPISDSLQREGFHIEEAAYLLGCGRTTVFRLMREGKLRVVKIGTRTIITRSEIARFLAEATQDGGNAG